MARTKPLPTPSSGNHTPKTLISNTNCYRTSPMTTKKLSRFAANTPQFRMIDAILTPSLSRKHLKTDDTNMLRSIQSISTIENDASSNRMLSFPSLENFANIDQGSDLPTYRPCRRTESFDFETSLPMRPKIHSRLSSTDDGDYSLLLYEGKVWGEVPPRDAPPPREGGKLDIETNTFAVFTACETSTFGTSESYNRLQDTLSSLSQGNDWDEQQ